MFCLWGTRECSSLLWLRLNTYCVPQIDDYFPANSLNKWIWLVVSRLTDDLANTDRLSSFQDVYQECFQQHAQLESCVPPCFPQHMGFFHLLDWCLHLLAYRTQVLHMQSAKGIRKIVEGTNNLKRADRWISHFEGLSVLSSCKWKNTNILWDF